MNKAFFRFYEELNDFLPPGRRNGLIEYEFTGNPSVKDAIEALAVPHVEVDLILVNGKSIDFFYRIKDEDFISVYPVFESFNIAMVTHLREKPLRDVKFIADVHLGKLARYLRLCGFDTRYTNDLTDMQIIDTAGSEKRTILTRDRILLKNKKVTHGYWIRSDDPNEQLLEIFRRFDLKKSITLFSRCLECNGILREIDKKEIIDRLLPLTKRYYRKFRICDNCNRIYWNGSHYRRMKEEIRKVTKVK